MQNLIHVLGHKFNNLYFSGVYRYFQPMADKGAKRILPIYSHVAPSAATTKKYILSLFLNHWTWRCKKTWFYGKFNGLS